MSWQDIKAQLEYEHAKYYKELQGLIDQNADPQDTAYIEGILVGINTALNLIRYYYE